MDTTRIFHALGHEHRLRIMMVLAKHDGTLSVNALRCSLTALGVRISQPCVTHHLNVLWEAGLIGRRANTGLHHYYAVCPDALEAAHMMLDNLAVPEKVRVSA